MGNGGDSEVEAIEECLNSGVSASGKKSTVLSNGVSASKGER